MACDLAAGYKDPCRSKIAGLRALYIANYEDVDGIVYDTTNTSAVTELFAEAGDSVYKFELLGTNNLTEASAGDFTTGTTAYTQTGSFQLKHVSAELNEIVQLLAVGRPIIVVEDYNGSARVMGLTDGCQVQVASDSGTAKADFAGYTLTVTATEPTLANGVDGAIAGNPFAGFTNAPTVVVGTEI